MVETDRRKDKRKRDRKDNGQTDSKASRQTDIKIATARHTDRIKTRITIETVTKNVVKCEMSWSLPF